MKDQVPHEGKTDPNIDLYIHILRVLDNIRKNKII
jgi:hypothetical protein